MVGLDIENPNMASWPQAGSSIDELEAMRYSERTPAKSRAAARGASAVPGDQGRHRNLVGVPFEALPA
ncbi:MAG: hypothetical protein U1F17_15795 [Burkholderiaceae bacterium]